MSEVLWPIVTAYAVTVGSLLCLRYLRMLEQARRPPATTKVDPLPPDLKMIALRESESWAQESVREAMLESYSKSGNWDVVRSEFGVNRQG